MNILSHNLHQKKDFKTKTVLKAFLPIAFFIFLVIPAQAYQFDTGRANSIAMTDISDGKDYISNQTALLYWNFTLDPEVLYANSGGLDQSFLQNPIRYYKNGADPYKGNYLIDMVNFFITNNHVQVIEHTLNGISQQSHSITANHISESATILFLGLGLFIIASISKKKLKINY